MTNSVGHHLAGRLRRFWNQGSISFAAELVLAAVSWYAIDAFKYLRLNVDEFILTYSAWILARSAASVSSVYIQSRIGAALLEMFVAAGWLFIISPHLRHPLSPAEIGYFTVFLAVIWQLWRGWRIPLGYASGGEQLRRLSILLLPIGLTAPYLTDKRLGGVDALWYSNMLKDFVLQSRAGFFPVYIGQGFEAYNGAIHPFRSGPICLWLGGAWDVVTFRVLPIFSLQHLTVISAAVFASVATYVGFTALRPRHRWAAVVFAFIYLSAAGVLKSIYCDEMYMTWMAIAALPIVVYGNARILLSNERGGWTALAIGLAAIWMCHPPVALVTTLCSIFIQIIGVSSRELNIKHLKNIAWSAAVFGALSLYYFVSMSELPSGHNPNLPTDLALIAALVLITGTAVKGIIKGRWLWLICGLPAFYILYRLHILWLIWGLTFWLVVALQQGWRRAPLAVNQLGVAGRSLLFATLIASITAWLLRSLTTVGPDKGALLLLDQYSDQLVAFFMPVSPSLDRFSDGQPGWNIWASVLFASSLFCFRKTSASGILASAALLLTVLFIRVPALSDFLVGFAPNSILGIANLPLTSRIVPPCAAFATCAGFLGWTTLGRFRRKTWLGLFLGVLALLYGTMEARKFLTRGWAVTSGRHASARGELPENMKLERFVYDLLPLTPYFSNNPTDPRLENRILDSNNNIVFDAGSLASKQEKLPSSRTVSLYAKTSPEAPQSLLLYPALTILPGENLLLRFAFEPKFSYVGVLLLKSPEGDYREYLLDQPGSRFSFGSAAENGKVISLANTTSKAVKYELVFLAQAGQKLGETEKFADLFVSQLSEGKSEIQLTSLIPFRATVRLDSAGQLETERSFIPGYDGTVDGQSVRLYPSPQGLVTVPIEAGTHQVQIVYQGTSKLRSAASISGLAWLFVISALIGRSIWPKSPLATVDLIELDAEEISERETLSRADHYGISGI